MLKYLVGYPEKIQQDVAALITRGRLRHYLLTKYPTPHTYSSDKRLFGYIMQIKNQKMKKSAPLSRASYDSTLRTLEHALGTHHFISRVQGGRLKVKNEIKIASLFREVPEAFLEMIVVHELAHFKQKGHTKAFYQLCCVMQPDYHQVEFDVRLYLTLLEQEGKIEAWARAIDTRS